MAHPESQHSIFCPPHTSSFASRENTLDLMEEPIHVQHHPSSQKPLEKSVVEVEEDSDIQVFRDFEGKINSLDGNLKDLADSFRRLGNPTDILASAYDVRVCLAEIKYLFCQNAANLFPDQIYPPQPSNIQTENPITKALAHATQPTVSTAFSPRDFPSRLRHFAGHVINFSTHLNEFPEFTDEAKLSMRSLRRDLRYWASCLEAYADDEKIDDRPVRLYIHELSSDMSRHFERLSSALFVFTQIDLTTVWQSARNQDVVQLSTSATFFSAVTATTLQYSIELERTRLRDVVNFLWFSSLVLSVAAAANSFMAVILRQDISRQTKYKMPWWILIWIRRSPAVFLVLSGACFLSGLCCFVFASKEAPLTSIWTTALTGFTSSGLIIVLVWLLLAARWKAILKKILVALQTPVYITMQAVRVISHITRRWNIRGRSSGKEDQKSILLPVAFRDINPLTPAPLPPFVTGSQATEVPTDMSCLPVPTLHLLPRLTVMETVQNLAENFGLIQHLQFSPDGRFLAIASKRGSVTYNVEDLCVSPRRHTLFCEDHVERVIWSPCGNILLTYHETTVKVWMSQDGQFSSRPECEFPHHGLTNSIAWLHKEKTFISVMSSAVTEIYLLPTPKFPFVSLHGSTVKKTNVHGKIIDQFSFRYIELHAARVTPDSSRLVGVGTFLQSPTGSRPDKAKPELKIIVYNMKTRRIEDHYPLLNNFGDITLSQGPEHRQIHVLISYRKQAPPQLWELELTSPTTSRLSLRLTYIPQSKVDFAGRSCFGGNNSELVISFGKAGDILIWHRESSELLRRIRTGSHLECVAWNCSFEGLFMFATGHNDGSIRIWMEKVQESVESSPSSSKPPSSNQ